MNSQHTAVTCDQVFDVLTRGPFPAGDPSDDAIELHLAACHECRCMAEALRPAVSLFHEAIDSDEKDRLPGYFGELDNVFVSEELDFASPQVEKSRSSSLARFASVLSWQVTAIVIAGMVSFALWSVSDSNVETSRTVDANSSISVPNEEGLNELLALKLPNACLPELGNIQELVGADSNSQLAFQCCTCCHSAGSSGLMVNSIALLANSCESCHQN